MSHHWEKTQCLWSKTQRDIRSGNWLIRENSICERCFVSGRGSRPSAMGPPVSADWMIQTVCSSLGCKLMHHCFQKEIYDVAIPTIHSCPVSFWFCGRPCLNLYWMKNHNFINRCRKLFMARENLYTKILIVSKRFFQSYFILRVKFPLCVSLLSCSDTQKHTKKTEYLEDTNLIWQTQTAEASDISWMLKYIIIII